MASVFISYSRRNEPVVRSLAKDIEELGHDVWFDKELSGGQVWWDRILESIRGCDFFVFALAQPSLDSIACKLEADYAEDLGKTVLPILVDDGVSTNLLRPALSKIQHVDYRQQDRNALLSLMKSFSHLPPAGPLPDPLPTPPDAPISYLSTLAERVSAAASLDYEGQSRLIIDLKGALRDPETADDARTLLERLRRRNDLYAKIAEEIDEILEVPGGATRNIPSRPQSPAQGDKGAKSRNAAQCALHGGIIGLIVGITAIAYEGDLADVWFFSIAPAAGGAIAGIISRDHWVPVFASLTMALAVSILWAASNISTPLVGTAGIFGAPIGAVIGAIAGIGIRKWRGALQPAPSRG